MWKANSCRSRNAISFSRQISCYPDSVHCSSRYETAPLRKFLEIVGDASSRTDEVCRLQPEGGEHIGQRPPSKIGRSFPIKTGERAVDHVVNVSCVRIGHQMQDRRSLIIELKWSESRIDPPSERKLSEYGTQGCRSITSQSAAWMRPLSSASLIEASSLQMMNAENGRRRCSSGMSIDITADSNDMRNCENDVLVE